MKGRGDGRNVGGAWYDDHSTQTRTLGFVTHSLLYY